MITKRWSKGDFDPWAIKINKSINQVKHLDNFDFNKNQVENIDLTRNQTLDGYRGGLHSQDLSIREQDTNCDSLYGENARILKKNRQIHDAEEYPSPWSYSVSVSFYCLGYVLLPS